MVEFVDKAVDVEIQARSDGTARPLAFIWHGRRYKIESWGREGQEERAGRRLYCHLVQTAGGDTWELCHDAEASGWTLARRWPAGRRIA